MTDEEIKTMILKGMKNHLMVYDDQVRNGEISSRLFKLLARVGKAYDLELDSVLLPTTVTPPVDTYIELDKYDNLVGRLKIFQSRFMEGTAASIYVENGGYKIANKRWLVVAYGKKDVLLGAV